MSEIETRICFDRLVPPEYARIARDLALTENPANASLFQAAGLHSKFWRPGRTLRVAFLDGDSIVQQKVASLAKQWSEYANITFDFGEYPNAEIRISFRQSGSWSAVGTDALIKESFLPGSPTMNFGWLTPHSTDPEYAAVVLHEFGHALGLIHEHQSPANGIEWDIEAVQADLSGPPNYWDIKTTEQNVFNHYTATETQYTEFDPKSIMLYAFPEQWTLNHLTFSWNTELSQADKGFIKTCYPK